MRKQKKWVKRRGKVQVRRMWQLFGLTHLSANRASCCRWSRGGASLLLRGAYLGGRTVCPEGEGSDLAPWFMTRQMVILGEGQRNCHNCLQCHYLYPVILHRLEVWCQVTQPMTKDFVDKLINPPHLCLRYMSTIWETIVRGSLKTPRPRRQSILRLRFLLRE